MSMLTRRNLISTAALGMAGAGGIRSSAADLSRDQRRKWPEVFCDVCEFGANGNGVKDNTEAFQKALDAIYSKGGGIVHVPAGRFLLTGSIKIPPETALEGVFRGPTSHPGFGGTDKAGKTTSPEVGTMLLATGGRGREEGPPLITLVDNAALLGLSISYPHQNWRTTPVAYPWTVRMKGKNCSVENVELLNPWQGIKAVQAHRHLIRNVTGQPLKTGIFVDEVYDIGRIEDVHFNPWWSGSRPVLEFMYRHGESFVFGRTDWEYVLNTFSFGYHAGYRFIEGKTGACNGNFLGIGADASWHACLVEQSQDPGLLITNGEFVSFDYLKLGNVDPAHVFVKPPNKGPVRFVNCSFWVGWGRGWQIARLNSSCTVGFGDCTFCQWDPSQYAIEAFAGKLLVRGCEFQQAAPQVRLHDGVSQAVITGNITAGKWQLANAAGKRAKIGLNSDGL